MSETTSAPPPSAPAAPAAPGADAAAAPRRGRPPNSARAPAPAAPAAAPAGQLGSHSAPPNAQPGISVSEAARMLGQQRRANAPEGAAQPAASPDRKPGASELARAAQAAEGQPAPPPPAPKAQTGASALERALGVSVDGTPAPATEAPPPSNEGAIEIEGQRYSQAQLREAVLKSNDYTQKMQALAERGRAMQQQQEALATVLPYIQPELQRLAEIVQNAPQRPDPALLESDPHAYLRAMAAFEQAREEQGRLGNLTVLQQQAQARALAEATAAANEQLAAEFPFWADPADRQAAQTEIANWAMNKGGFSREELRNLTSPHHLKAMMKAAMFDRMMEGAKSATPAPKLAAPVRGAPPPAAPSERIQQAAQAFGDRPNFRSGAALLAARRAGNRQ